MHQDKPQEFIIITSQDGVWREEKLSLAQEKGYSPWQWERAFKEKMSPGYESAMKGLRSADTHIARFSDELNYLLNLLPSDPTKLPDIALILIEIRQRLDSIVEAGKQVEPAKNKKLQDFYGRFHIKIPEDLRRTASDDKIATAGLIGNFVHWIGRKLYELGDTETREMKRVVAHLLNTTKQTVKSINKTLNDMRSARKTGDIDKYIEGVQFISKEQVGFKNEFSVIYDSYLREPYKHALHLEEEAKEEARIRGEEFKQSYEEVSINDHGRIDVIEVDSPSPEEVAPLDVAEEAEKPIDIDLDYGYKPRFGPPNVDIEYSQQELLTPSDSELPPTVPGDIEYAHQTDPDTAPSTKPDPDTAPSTERSPGIEYGIEGKPPSSSEMDISPSQPIPQPKPQPHLLPDGTWSDKPKPQEEKRLRIEEQPLPEGIASQVEEVITKVSHARFIAELDKIANTENKYIVAAFMAKYSKKLEEINPQASAAILNIAQEISND